MASSSSSSTTPSAASSSSISVSSAASSSSRPPADAALAPGLDYDTAFPVLGSSRPSRPRSSSAAPPPRLLRRSEDRQRGDKTPSYTFHGAAPGRAAATAEAGHASAGRTSAGTISAHPPTCAAPGSFAAAAAVLSGAPALLPAVQAFGGYSFGYTMGDLFQDLRLRPPSPQVDPPALRQHLQAVNEPRHPPLLRPQRLQPPRHFNAPMAQVQLQRPPPRFQAPLNQRGASDAARGAAPPHAIPVRASAGVLDGFRQGTGQQRQQQYLVQSRRGDSGSGGVILLRTGALDWEVRCDDAMVSTSANAITSGTAAKVGGPKAARDVLLARGRYGGGVAIRLRVATNIGATYWFLAIKDRMVELMGSAPRYRPTGSWSWLDIMGCPIPQEKLDSCSQSACLMCLEAQHRLAFERRHGSDTFPYHIPPSTATDLVARCKSAGVWTRKDGATIDNVLRQIQRAGGAEAWPDQEESWERCKLQVKSWDSSWRGRRLPSASTLARTIRNEGPIIGCLVVGPEYDAHSWQKRVYRGGESGKKAGAHAVVCTGYRDEGEEIEVVDNHAWDGPAKRISKTAFTAFTRIKVEPLDACALGLGKEVSWWRRLESRLWREETCWWLRRRRISEHWSKIFRHLDKQH